MGNLQAKSCLNRQHSPDVSDAQREIQRLEQLDEQPVKQTKIIDLSDDCLVNIFNHLNLMDLFNVAVSNEYLRPAANEVYKRKFSTNRSIIFEFNDRPNIRSKIRFRRMGSSSPLEVEPSLVFDARSVRINELKKSLQYLRCFGALISAISIDYRYVSYSKRYQHVHDYIEMYCTESLIRVGFNHISKNSMPPFKTPFNNVTSVSVTHADLRNRLPSFVDCFPNLNRFGVYNVRLNKQLDAVPFRVYIFVWITAAYERAFIIDWTLLGPIAKFVIILIHQFKALEKFNFIFWNKKSLYLGYHKLVCCNKLVCL